MTAERRLNGNSYKLAGAPSLSYVSDAEPGIRRQRRGKAFRYVREDGRPVRDPQTLARIRSLAIPPAWSNVWICGRDNGHLQATGRDARGRKQYRYHARWRELRDDNKYGRMIPFARALPRMRRRVACDLARPGLPREKVLATLVRLLEATRMRIGNEEYARENASYGLTTLRGRQVRVRGANLHFRFRGKSGVEHVFELADPYLAGIVRRMQELPGEELFCYADDAGETRRIESADVNAYLKAISGADFTSKDFRTWAGTVLAARALCALGPFGSQSEAKHNAVQAIDTVAKALGNTQAVCRKCYVHPAIVDAYLEGRLAESMHGRSEERGVAAVLESRRKRDRAAAPRDLARPLYRSLAARARRLQDSPPSIARGTP